jgi:hypothetical protein
MPTAGYRRSGRTLLIVVLIVLVIALVVIVWERNVPATAPLAPPVKPRTEMVPILPYHQPYVPARLES